MGEITVGKIMKHKPCPDWTREMVAKKIGNGKTLLEISRLRGVSDDDKIWCITRFLSDEQNKHFAIWCARQCKTDVPEIGAYIDAIEAYYFGDGTGDEMWAACDAACDVAYNVACSASRSAAHNAVHSARRAAERKKQMAKIRILLGE